MEEEPPLSLAKKFLHAAWTLCATSSQDVSNPFASISILLGGSDSERRAYECPKCLLGFVFEVLLSAVTYPFSGKHEDTPSLFIL